MARRERRRPARAAAASFVIAAAFGCVAVAWWWWRRLPSPSVAPLLRLEASSTPGQRPTSQDASNGGSRAQLFRLIQTRDDAPRAEHGRPAHGGSPNRDERKTRSSSSSRRSTMSIPDVLHFTYAFDLLRANETSLSAIEKLLRENVLAVVAMHRGARVMFTDDVACEAMLVDHGDETLLTGWKAERAGMHRGDVCRGLALFKMGGYYFDLDLLVRFDVREVIRPGTTFATSHQYDQHNPGAALAVTTASPDDGDGETGGDGMASESAARWRSTVDLNATGANGFFQAFLASAPGHELVRRYLRRMSEHYSGRAVAKSGAGAGALGVYALGEVFAEWTSEVGRETARRTTQLFSELRLEHFAHVPEVAAVRRQNGAGCCCNFVVYDEDSRRVPFYSRIVGVCDGGNNGCCDFIPGQDVWAS